MIKTINFFLAILLLSLGQANAQGKAGVYWTKEDFLAGKMEPRHSFKDCYRHGTYWVVFLDEKGEKEKILAKDMYAFQSEYGMIGLTENEPYCKVMYVRGDLCYWGSGNTYSVCKKGKLTYVADHGFYITKGVNGTPLETNIDQRDKKKLYPVFNNDPNAIKLIIRGNFLEAVLQHNKQNPTNEGYILPPCK